MTYDDEDGDELPPARWWAGPPPPSPKPAPITPPVTWHTRMRPACQLVIAGLDTPRWYVHRCTRRGSGVIGPFTRAAALQYQHDLLTGPDPPLRVELIPPDRNEETCEPNQQPIPERDPCLPKPTNIWRAYTSSGASAAPYAPPPTR